MLPKDIRCDRLSTFDERGAQFRLSEQQSHTWQQKFHGCNTPHAAPTEAVRLPLPNTLGKRTPSDSNGS